MNTLNELFLFKKINLDQVQGFFLNWYDMKTYAHNPDWDIFLGESLIVHIKTKLGYKSIS